MLVLTRRLDEKIIIGNQIQITILEVINNRVRIGIQAPANISVHREEVYLRIKQEEETVTS